MIDEVNTHDEGRYTCIATNKIGQMRSSSNLFVYGAVR